MPRSLLTSFQKFAEYPTNLVFEPSPTDVKLRSYHDRLDKSTQTRYILVQFLDLGTCMELSPPLRCKAYTNSTARTEPNAAVPSTVISVDSEDTEVTNDADLKEWIEAGVKVVVQPPSAPAVGNPVPAITNNLVQQRPSSPSQTISRQRSTSSQHTIPAQYSSPNQIPQLVPAPISLAQPAPPASRAFVKDPKCRFM